MAASLFAAGKHAADDSASTSPSTVDNAKESVDASTADNAGEDAGAGAASNTVVAEHYTFEIPEYWRGKVDVKVDGDSVRIYPKGFAGKMMSNAYPDGITLCSLNYVSDPEHVGMNGGDCSSSLMFYLHDQRGGVEVHSANWPVFYVSDYKDQLSQYLSQEQMATYVDLSTGGKVHLSDLPDPVDGVDDPNYSDAWGQAWEIGGHACDDFFNEAFSNNLALTGEGGSGEGSEQGEPAAEAGDPTVGVWAPNADNRQVYIGSRIPYETVSLTLLSLEGSEKWRADNQTDSVADTSPRVAYVEGAEHDYNPELGNAGDNNAYRSWIAENTEQPAAGSGNGHFAYVHHDSGSLTYEVDGGLQNGIALGPAVGARGVTVEWDPAAETFMGWHRVDTAPAEVEPYLR